MAKVNENSFEARDKKNKKRSSIVKMSELRAEIFEPAVNEAKEEQKKEVANNVIKTEVTKSNIKEKREEELKNEKNNEALNIITEINEKDVKNLIIDEVKNKDNHKVIESHDLIIEASTQKTINEELETLVKPENDFFNLNVKNDVFEGKMTTVRVYDDILDKLKTYAKMKNYPIIEFTNKVITLGLDDFESFGVLEISEIKLKNNTSRSIMYNLTDIMEVKLNKYIDELNAQGYRVSRNVILNVILNETLKKFYI